MSYSINICQDCRATGILDEDFIEIDNRGTYQCSNCLSTKIASKYKDSSSSDGWHLFINKCHKDVVNILSSHFRVAYKMGAKWYISDRVDDSYDDITGYINGNYVMISKVEL